jgi:hypothetical protein
MPRKGKSPSQLASAAAESIQSLNRATTDNAAYRYPGDVDDTVQALRTLAVLLPQAISQGSLALTRLAADGRVCLDAMAGDPLAEHMAETMKAATVAVEAATGLEHALKRLGGRTCHLAYAEPTAVSR